MKGEFAPYLKDVLPTIFTVASLNPTMGISGSEGVADLNDVINELKTEPLSGEGAKLNVNTDETEEKDVAI